MARCRLLLAGLVLLIAAPVLAGQEGASSVTPEQIAAGCSGPGVTLQPTRMPPIPEEKYTAAQKETVTEFHKIRGSSSRGVFGPYVALLRSPEVLLHTVRLGHYLQFQSRLPAKLKQFTIAITARQWSQQYMWNVHCPGAVREGLNPTIAKALLNGQRPPGMSEEEALVYDFTDELHRNQSVSDATYARAVEKFGEPGVIDMIGINAYYTFLAMVANTARLPVNPKTQPNLPGFPY